MTSIRPHFLAKFLSVLALLLCFTLAPCAPALAQDGDKSAASAPAKSDAKTDAGASEPAKSGAEKSAAKSQAPVEVPEWMSVLPQKYQQSAARAWDWLKVFLAQNLLGALVIFVIGRIGISFLCRIARKVMGRAKLEETLIDFLINLIKMLLLAFVVLAALQQLGVDTTSFAAIVAAAGFAIGFALQGSLGNFAAGVMLIVFKPFKKGDVIEAGGTKGAVQEIGVFVTKIKTPDNVVTVVPNSSVTGGNITNFSAEATRRVDMSFGCAYSDDLKAVKAYLLEEVANNPKVLAEPAPAVFVSGLGDSSVDFAVRPWVKSGDYWAVMAELTEAIKVGFDERGFNFPFPSREVFMTQVNPETK